MKRYDEYDDQPVRMKRPKHAKNRPGQGMRVLNMVVEEDFYEVDSSEDFNYNYDTPVNNDTKRL